MTGHSHLAGGGLGGARPLRHRAPHSRADTRWNTEGGSSCHARPTLSASSSARPSRTWPPSETPCGRPFSRGCTRCAPTKSAAWGRVEQTLQRTLAAGAHGLGLPAERLLRYTASATHQDIAAGLLNAANAGVLPPR